MAVLVDYSSSSSSSSNTGDASSQPPQKKRRKETVTAAGSDSRHRSGMEHQARAEIAEATTDGNVGADTDTKIDGTAPGMPPLPATFHDLYASTVRQSVTDDPALHHGRKRQTPHIAGQWPSHVYVEWHPSPAEHEKLTELVNAVRQVMADEVAIHDFLTSELGSPLPLHISLSRPLSLSTSAKDLYLDKVTDLLRESGIGSFDVHPISLGWFKSPDSDRSFLIIRVCRSKSAGSDEVVREQNPELMTLLKQCNAAAASFGQPPLYQKNKDELVDEAFHVSIGWTLGLPSDNASFQSFKLFKREGFESIKNWTIPISGVKVKIGNSVHHVALEGASGKGELFD